MRRPSRLNVEFLEDRSVPAVLVETEVIPYGETIYHLFQDGHELGKVTYRTDTVVAFTPRPDLLEPNGYGSSFLLAPYLTGGDAFADIPPTVTANNPANNFTVTLGGTVSGLGTWSETLTIAFDSNSQTVTATGALNIALPASLAAIGADMNLGRIASAYLDTVPVFPVGSMWQSNGHIRRVDVGYGTDATPPDESWVPTDGDLIPNRTSPALTLNAVGDLYKIDLKLFGGIPEVPSRKPNLQVTYTSANGFTPMGAELIYDTALSQTALVENVSASHVARAGFQQTRNFQFDVSLVSTPITFRPPPTGLAVTGGSAPRLYVSDGTTYTEPTAAYFGGDAKAEATARPAVGDVNGDSAPDTIFVTGPGEVLRVWVVSGHDNQTVLVPKFDPFGDNFLGGGFIAAADLDGDGRDEMFVTPDQGGGPRVSIFSFTAAGTTVRRGNFFGIDDSSFRGGARVGVGDVNNDGTPDVVVAAGFLGGPRASVIDGRSVTGSPRRLVADFFAFPGTDAINLRNGAYVAVGDTNGDGFGDLIFGSGPGGAPRIFVLSGLAVLSSGAAAAQAAPLANFFVDTVPIGNGGIRVAAKDQNGDGRADIVAGNGAGQTARVRIYRGDKLGGVGEPTEYQDLYPYPGTLPGGVFVG